MHQVFDVPGSIVLRDVSRPAQGETPAQRTHRLAQKAVVEGCRITRLAVAGNYLVTSARASDGYLGDLGIGFCACPGFAAHKVCKHSALAIATETVEAVAERDRLRALDASGRLKTTRDLHNLQEAERRAEWLALVPLGPRRGRRRRARRGSRRRLASMGWRSRPRHPPIDRRSHPK